MAIYQNRDPYIVHLNIATCEWWCPFILVLKKQHVSNGCQMYHLRSPGRPGQKEWMVAKSILRHRNEALESFNSPVNTNKQWVLMVSKWCRIYSM